MASAYSTIRQYGDFIPPNDLDLVMKGLSYKQNQYDANRAKVEQTLAELSSIDLIRDVDKQYFHDRLSDFLGEVNKAGKLDLSDSNLTRNIENYMKDALDNNVMEAYVSTKKIRKTLDDIEAIKQKKPELYSIQNEDFALEGVREYVQNPNIGAKYNGQSYIPYKDVNKIINDRIKDADKFIKNIRKVSSVSGDYFVDESNEMIDPSKLQSLIESTLSPDLRQQLYIDARYAYKNVDEGRLREAVSNDYSKAISKLNAKKKLIESDLLGKDPSNDDYKKLDGYLTDIKNQINVFQNKANSIKDMDLNALKTNIYTENLIDNKLKTYGGIISSERKLRSDPTAYRYQKLAQDLALARERMHASKERESKDREVNTIDPNEPKMVDIPTQVQSVDDITVKFNDNIKNANVNLKQVLISEASNDLSNIDDNTFLAKYGIKKSEFDPNKPDQMLTIFKSKMGNNPDSKLIPLNSKLRVAYDSQNYLNEIRKQANDMTAGTVKNVINDILFGLYGGKSNYMSNSLIPEFQIKKDTKGNAFIQFTGKKVPWRQVFGDKEATLDKQIGNTGKTYRDMAHAVLATELLHVERDGSLKDGNNRNIEALTNYVNKIFGGKQTNYKVKDSKNYVSSLWDVTGALLNKGTSKAKTLFNKVMGWDNTQAQKEYEQASKAYDESHSGTRVSNHVIDAARDQANIKYMPINGKIVSYNPVQHLMELTYANRFSSQNDYNKVKYPNGITYEDAAPTLRTIKKNDLAPSNRGTGVNASIKERFNSSMELLHSKIDNLYTEGVGKLSTDVGYTIDPKSKLGSSLKTIIEGKSRFDKEPIIIDNHSITYKKNNLGGISVNVITKEGKKIGQREIDLSYNELPASIQKQLVEMSYNPAYDARTNKNVNINYSATLLKDNTEKLSYSKKNNIPIEALLTKDDLYDNIAKSLPPDYLKDFSQKYSKALDYLTRNKNTVSMVSDGKGRFVKQWKVGDVVVKLEPTNIQYLSENQVSSMYDMGLLTIQDLIQDAVKSYATNGRSRELDEIVTYLKAKNGK